MACLCKNKQKSCPMKGRWPGTRNWIAQRPRVESNTAGQTQINKTKNKRQISEMIFNHILYS